MGSDLLDWDYRFKAYISIHAPRMGSDVKYLPVLERMDFISIHAPRMGSDLPTLASRLSSTKFQSTLPAWGATMKFNSRYSVTGISIHAPRMGSDRYLFS